MESHDEERVMYKNLEFGNSSGSYSTKTLATALDRMELAGAFYFTIPGPKMIWQFGELGYDIGIDEGGRTGNKPILWNYYTEPDRKEIYDTWAKLIKLKKQVPIFKTGNFDLNVANSNGLKKIHLTNDDSNPDVKHITIIGNFGLTTQIISPEFQQTGTWYDLLNDNESITVVSVSAPISLQPGEFKVYGTSAVTLGVENLSINDLVSIYPNPITDTFNINTATNKVAIYDISGRMVKSFNGNFEQNKSFDISNLRPAIYLVKLQSELGFATKKLIKN